MRDAVMSADNDPALQDNGIERANKPQVSVVILNYQRRASLM